MNIDNRCFWEVMKNVKTLTMYGNITEVIEVDKTWMENHIKDIGRINREMNKTKTSHSFQMITIANNTLKQATAIVHLPFMREDSTDFYEYARMTKVGIHIVT